MNRPTLSDIEAVTKVQLFDFVPELMPEPAAGVIQRVFNRARTNRLASVALAIWSDGTWAVLAHNPAWLRPRPQQLVRAYRASFAAGIRIPCASLTVGDAI